MSAPRTRWIDNAVASFALDARSVSIFRIAFSLYCLLFGAIPNIFYLSSYPGSFFTPPIGPAAFFTDFPSAPLLWVLFVASVVAGVMMLFGMFTRWSSLLYALLTMFASAFAFSLGKINHNTAFTFLPMILAFSDWGAHYSWDALHRRVSTNVQRNAAAVFVYALTLGWLFFTAGIPKIVGGWLALSTQAVYGYVMQMQYTSDVRAPLAALFIKITPKVVWEAADWLTPLFEITFLTAAFRRRNILLWCCFATIFHFLVLNMLGIDSAGFLICYLVVVDWRAIADRRPFAKTLLEYWNRALRFAIPLGVVLVALLIVVNVLWGAPVDAVMNMFIHTTSGVDPISYVTEIIGVCMAIAYLIARTTSAVAARGADGR